MTKQEEQSRKLLEKTSDEVFKVFEEGFKDFLSTGAAGYEITQDGNLRNMTYGEIMLYDAERRFYIVPPVCTTEELDGKGKKVYEHFEDAPIVKHNRIKMFCKQAFNRLFFWRNCKDYGGERYNKDE